MNFLELVQLLHSEAGASGGAPATVIDQTGEALRLANWIISADSLVQGLWHNWKFLRAEYSADTVAGTRTAVAPTSPALVKWDEATFFLDDGTDKMQLEVVEYESVKSDIFDLTVGGRDMPAMVVIMPDNSLRFDPVPDAVYTITADYFKSPTILAADDDDSDIPEEFHRNVILGRALMFYGNFENAAEAKEQGVELYSHLGRLESLQLPKDFASPYTSDGNEIEVIAQ